MPSKPALPLALPFLTLCAQPAIGSLLLDHRPAWVWNGDGSRIIWSNAAGMAFFEEDSMEALLARTFGDVHPARRHLARLARNAQPNVPLLDRLRFFLGAKAITATCLCKRLEVEGESVLLVLATELPGRPLTEEECAQPVDGQAILSALSVGSGCHAALINAQGMLLGQSEHFGATLDVFAQSGLVLDDGLAPLRVGADAANGLALVNDVHDARAPSLMLGVARLGTGLDRNFLAMVAPLRLEGAEDDDAAFIDFDDILGTTETYLPTDHLSSETADIFDDIFTTEPAQTGDRPHWGLLEEELAPFVTDLQDAHGLHGSCDIPTNGDADEMGRERARLDAETFGASEDTPPIRLVPNLPEPDASADPGNIVRLQFGSQPSLVKDMKPYETGGSDFDTDPDLAFSGPASSDPASSGDDDPLHFTWQSDEVGRFTAVTDNLARAVGSRAADILGRSWREVADQLGMDEDGAIERAFHARETWVGLEVLWPVLEPLSDLEPLSEKDQGSSLEATHPSDRSMLVELTGLPVFGRLHGFQGFKGFGVCRPLHQNVGVGVTETSADAPPGMVPNMPADMPSDVSSGVASGAGENLLSDSLLCAAKDAVRAARALVGGMDETDESGPHQSKQDAKARHADEIPTVTEKSKSCDETHNVSAAMQALLAEAAGKDGVDAVSDDNQDLHTGNNETDIAQTHEQEAKEAGMDAGEQPSSPVSPYERVTSILDGSGKGAKELQDPVPVCSDLGDDDLLDEEDTPSLYSLSKREQDAFNAIGKTLIIEGEDDLDDDLDDEDEFEELFDDDFDEDEEDEAAIAATADSSCPDLSDTDLSDTGLSDTGLSDSDLSDSDLSGTDLSGTGGDDDQVALETGKAEPTPRIEQDGKPGSQTDDLQGDVTVPVSGLGALPAFDGQNRTDDTFRSAASNAFRDILAMDPAFRHMRGRLGELNGDDGTEASIAGDSVTGEEEETAVSAPHSFTISANPNPEEASQEQANAGVSDDAAVAPDINPAETIADSGDVDPVAPTADPSEDELREDALGEDALGEDALGDSAPDGAALAAASMAMQHLWDGQNKSSALVDIFNKMHVAMIVSANDQVLFASRPALRMLGYETVEALEEVGGMAGLFAGRPGDWLTKTNGRTTLKGGDGAPVSVNATISSINWGDTPAAMMTFKAAPNEPPSIGVSEEDEKIAELEAILDTATDGVVVLDGEANILRMNHSAEALFEVDRHAVAGKSFLTLLARESHKDALDYLDGLTMNGVASVLNDGREVIGQIQSGGLIPLFMTMGRVAVPGTNRFCAVLRDIAQWKRVEEELVAEKHRAELASNHKSDFLAKISHEIRTPLNAVIGFSEVMIEERFGAVSNDRYKEYLKDIHVSGNHIMSLVNDLLDLSKVEAGKLELNFEATELNRLVAETVGIMQPQANREQIIIRTSLASSLPDVVADNRSLRQIVLNLLSNGVKYTPAGGQVIISTVYEETGEVVLRIRDTGVGMSEAEVEMALEPFRQIPNGRGASKGTGLGLPLTKALAEANRAHFSLTSDKEHGTLVEITFPNARVLAG